MLISPSLSEPPKCPYLDLISLICPGAFPVSNVVHLLISFAALFYSRFYSRLSFSTLLLCLCRKIVSVIFVFIFQIEAFLIPSTSINFFFSTFIISTAMLVKLWWIDPNSFYPVIFYLDIIFPVFSSIFSFPSSIWFWLKIYSRCVAPTLLDSCPNMIILLLFLLLFFFERKTISFKKIISCTLYLRL